MDKGQCMTEVVNYRIKTRERRKSEGGTRMLENKTKERNWRLQ